MQSEIVITAVQKHGVLVPDTAPWRHELDGIKGKNLKSFAKAIDERLTARHLSDNQNVRVIAPVGEILIPPHAA